MGQHANCCQPKVEKPIFEEEQSLQVDRFQKVEENDDFERVRPAVEEFRYEDGNCFLIQDFTRLKSRSG